MSKLRKLEKIRFVVKPIKKGSRRRHWLKPEETLFVLARLPEETWSRLRTIHFNDDSWGARVAGYVTRGRRDITICAMPESVSLTRYLLKNNGSPSDFGAVRNQPWPAVAVRRYLLYNTFLHELGHLQVVDEKARSNRRKFAHERKAQEFAEHWRRQLWSTDPGGNEVLHDPLFEGALSDPAHYPPSTEAPSHDRVC